MQDIIKRAKHTLSGEDGMFILEAAIVCIVVCLLTAYLLQLLGVVINFGTTRNGWTSSTGWFRSSDVTGIINRN